MSVAEESEEAHEAAALWCIRLSEGRLTDAEQQRFRDWLAGGPGHQSLFERTVVAWSAMEDQAAQPELLALREDALAGMRRAGARRWHRSAGLWRQAAAVAAALLLMVGAGLWWRLSPTTYGTDVGERQVVALSDGSVLSLDAATSVRVRYLGDRRELWLERGRAKFSVAKDPLRPFTVQAGNRMVVATGTEFSVERLAGQTRVILYEGHVAVLDMTRPTPLPITVSVGMKRATSEQALRPGSEMILSDVPVPALAGQPVALAATGRIVPVEAGRTLGWEAGILEFTDEPLSDAAERMNRYSRRKLHVTGQIARSTAISGQFAGGDIDAFVEGITAVFPLRAVPEANGDVDLQAAPLQPAKD